MGAFKNPSLHASAMQMAWKNYSAAIIALWKNADIGQPDCYLAPKPHFVFSAASIFGLASIFFKRRLRSLFASAVARNVYDFVRAASIPQSQPCFQFGALRFVCLWIIGCGLSARCIAPWLLGVPSRDTPAGHEFLEVP
jgi:hypothetical protein